MSWTGGGTSATRLRDWLDPTSSGVTTLNGRNAGSTSVDNDDFADATLMSGVSGQKTGSNTGATKQLGEPDHAGNTGGKSVWWKWTAPSRGTVTIDTRGSSFDTLLGVYTGSSVSALTEVASNDDLNPGVDQDSRVTFQATTGTVYRIAVDGYNADSGSIVLNWSLQEQQGGSPGLPLLLLDD
jgi:hypothetical protein